MVPKGRRSGAFCALSQIFGTLFGESAEKRKMRRKKPPEGLVFGSESRYPVYGKQAPARKKAYAFSFPKHFRERKTLRTAARRSLCLCALVFQQLHHAVYHGGFFIAEGGNVQKALVLAAEEIVHRHAEHIGDADHHFERRQTDVRFVGWTPWTP